ncbi:hypothetical protein SELMODRAFT_416241 [Selaginella moellendorffii]|uniref:Uncharacterized protein n=1 Tax=Selaginella moellendorffii TaxID=88036 RepID=D8RYN4_SELML|nr:hypothetical protein SELMODRAFT_416241 [Selaginella moellendorffii]
METWPCDLLIQSGESGYRLKLVSGKLWSRSTEITRPSAEAELAAAQGRGADASATLSTATRPVCALSLSFHHDTGHYDNEHEQEESTARCHCSKFKCQKTDASLVIKLWQ